jgi:hypothetical protein
LQDLLDLLVLKDPLDLRAMRVPKDRKVKLVRKATLGTSDLRDHKDLREQIRLLLDRKAILVMLDLQDLKVIQVNKVP